MEQPTLFEVPPEPERRRKIRPLRHAIWTENKARLIERYLYYFVLITKHGTYVDGFAGPQDPGAPDSWAAKLVLESEPPWLRRFYLFDASREQVGRLNELKEAHSDRLIQVVEEDFNVAVHQLLASGAIGEQEATFCLLDQRTFECHWSTLEALAAHKTIGMKIELFYFLPIGWLDRALTAQKDEAVIKRWWGGDDWEATLGDGRPWQRAERVCKRMERELGYASVIPWPIYKGRNGGRVMYFMLHASDHPEAPNLMHRAYHKAVGDKEPLQGVFVEFEEWRRERKSEGGR